MRCWIATDKEPLDDGSHETFLFLLEPRSDDEIFLRTNRSGFVQVRNCEFAPPPGEKIEVELRPVAPEPESKIQQLESTVRSLTETHSRVCMENARLVDELNARRRAMDDARTDAYIRYINDQPSKLLQVAMHLGAQRTEWPIENVISGAKRLIAACREHEERTSTADECRDELKSALDEVEANADADCENP